MGKAGRIAARLILASALVLPVHAQSVASVISEDGDRFAVFHAQLDRAADVALAVERMADAASVDRNHTLPHSADSLVADFGQHYRPPATLGVTAAMKRLDQLRPVVEPILQNEGIPLELASMIVVESGGRTNALSAKGALGLWQLMPGTARRYGLAVNAHIDERVDVEKSTHAAARYLGDLYRQFGSWPLALAGYNAGEQTVQRAIDRAASLDFLRLSQMRLLPQETLNYVSAVLFEMQLLGTRELPLASQTIRTTQVGAIMFADSVWQQ